MRLKEIPSSSWSWLPAGAVQFVTITGRPSDIASTIGRPQLKTGTIECLETTAINSIRTLRHELGIQTHLDIDGMSNNRARHLPDLPAVIIRDASWATDWYVSMTIIGGTRDPFRPSPSQDHYVNANNDKFEKTYDHE